jgi:hypothetical protein
MKSSISGSISVSDPWELVSVIGDAPLNVIVETWNRERAMLRLVTPFQFDGDIILTAVASVRHLGRDFAERSVSVPANISFQSGDLVPVVTGIGTLSFA